MQHWPISARQILALALALASIGPLPVTAKTEFRIVERLPDGSIAPAIASAYEAAQPGTDENGVVSFILENGRRYYHPFNVATQALADKGLEGTAGLYIETIVAQRPTMSPAQLAALKWLVDNKVDLPEGGITWSYPLPLYYTTFTVFPGWSSAFSEARAIHALIYAARVSRDRQYLDLAVRAAKAYGTPIEDGGLVGRVDGLPFYEEVPVPGEHSPHILNGHLYSLVALYDLAKETGDPAIKSIADQGLATIEKLASLYDTGYWTKYDLVPRVTGILFLVKGETEPVTVNSGAVIAPTGEELPLELVSVDKANSLFKANLPGPIFLNDARNQTYRLRIDFSGRLSGVGLAGLRPDINEYYRLSPDTAPSSSAAGTATYIIPIQYLSDFKLSRIYQRWHSRLMKRLGEQTGSSWFLSVADRWWGYDLATERDQSQAGASGPILRDAPGLPAR
ncbi:hypothetical protein ASE61_00660 [Bosea sp. Root670]|uniref:D-glucuronyl C5-epimerase family protein n=1 Tax=Bosea sp. Root670 TaxID=1736583 RepID=UPI000714C1EF|nr:D-glucuronyl C5-epimerase family protein [Bosea sp. Root670]KRE08162.1 hypothetical protein ASE61_00660 [Bosea sp. Root670]